MDVDDQGYTWIGTVGVNGGFAVVRTKVCDVVLIYSWLTGHIDTSKRNGMLG